MYQGGFQKPENILKKADDLIKVGSRRQALDTLYEVLSMRRFRTWQPMHEKVMERFLELCVESRDNRMAKEGLHQYRNLSQHQAPTSLETVIEYMLTLAEDKAKKAAAECDKRLLDALEDLESDRTPENILLLSVSSEKGKERTEREHLVPWLKFLWESYRSVLEILRNNTRLETLYHLTARRTFNFCMEYHRNTEFRKLCETLRSHANKSKETEFNAETVELQLATRFEQLKVASSLRLWNEGFRTIEDIHYIFSKTDKRPSSQLEATYYQKLTDLFLISENYLFHAYAYKAYYLLSIEKNKSLTQEQSAVMASCVLLSAMSIPLQTSKVGTTYSHKDSQKQKNRKMAQLLGFDINPKRKSIIQDLLENAILDVVLDDVKELYFCLECEFQPLQLVKRVIPLLNKIKEDEKLGRYVKALENLLIVRCVNQLSNVFYSLRLDYLQDLLKDLGKTPLEIENIIVKGVKTRQIDVYSFRIDHVAGCIQFGEDFMEEQRTRRLLTDMSRGLQTICNQLEPVGKAKLYAENRAVRAKTVLQHLEHTHATVLRRKDIIEKRKEEYARLEQTRKVEEERKRLERERARKEEEVKRIEMQRRQRADRELENIKEQERQFMLRQQLVEEGVDINESNVKSMTTDEQQKLIEETRKKALRANQDTERKIQAASKRLDALVRALREKEVDTWAVKYEEKCKQDEIEHKANWKHQLASSKDEHKKAVVFKKEYERMQTLRTGFEEKLLQHWRASYEADRAKRYRACEQRLKHDKLDRARKLKQRKEKENIRKREEEARVERERQKKALEEERKRREAEQRANEVETQDSMQSRQGYDDKPPMRDDRSPREGGAYRPPRGGDDRFDDRPPPRSDRMEEPRGGYDDRPRRGGYGESRGGYGGDRFGDSRGGGDRFGDSRGGGDRFGDSRGGGDRFGDSRGGGDRNPFGGSRRGGDRYESRGGGDRFGDSRGGGDRFGDSRGGGDRFGDSRGGGDRFGDSRGGGDRFGDSRGGDRGGRRGGRGGFGSAGASEGRWR
eukprot:CAMPEP_0203749038 /NCGR_PEP_ID=MMETSP0098-20131031/3735_1 /ASSEMBLY_ACC=CAM_ASM_000208 /TAXON_ID=96639 /ORGANISM=" , Strain NY0313808BC1" /LENGTH=1021 /DNA_ID=CAMNT_0050637967 /DNA_START=190 /DNA_END=3255 /DNA_ORIENTATION=-